MRRRSGAEYFFPWRPRSSGEIVPGFMNISHPTLVRYNRRPDLFNPVPLTGWPDTHVDQKSVRSLVLTVLPASGAELAFKSTLETMLPAACAFLCMYGAKYPDNAGVPVSEFTSMFNTTLGDLSQTMLRGLWNRPKESSEYEIPFIFRDDIYDIVDLLLERNSGVFTSTRAGNLHLHSPCAFLSLTGIGKGEEDVCYMYKTAVPNYVPLHDYLQQGLNEVNRLSGVFCSFKAPDDLPVSLAEPPYMQFVYLGVPKAVGGGSVAGNQAAAGRALESLRHVFVKLYDSFFRPHHHHYRASLPMV